jgi:hypothetical protein
MVRIMIQAAGPIDSYGIRYNNMGDRTSAQEYDVA